MSIIVGILIDNHNVYLKLYRDVSCSNPVASRAPDNTGAIVGGAVAVVLILTTAMTIIVVVVLMRNHCSQPAQRPMGYVDTIDTIRDDGYIVTENTVLSCTGNPQVQTF